MSAQAFVTAGILSLAIAAGALTVTKARISAPLRDRATAKSKWLGELVSCPYCFSHWLSFAAVAAYRPALVHSGFIVLDLLVAAMAMVAVSALVVSAIMYSMNIPR